MDRDPYSLTFGLQLWIIISCLFIKIINKNTKTTEIFMVFKTLFYNLVIKNQKYTFLLIFLFLLHLLIKNLLFLIYDVLNDIFLLIIFIFSHIFQLLILKTIIYFYWRLFRNDILVFKIQFYNFIIYISLIL